MTMAPRDGGAEEGAGVVDLWAMAAELERQFAGYKQRFPERSSSSCVDGDDDGIVAAGDGDSRVDAGGVSNGRIEDEEEAGAGDGDGGDGGGGVRGRMYEAYTRRRDERLRSVWRARMERKEAEVMALWARLRAGGPAAAAADDDDDDGCTAGEEAEEDGEKRRSSDVAAPGRVSGKKHARARRSFSSANLVKSSRPEVGLRRALSQEPLPPEPPAGAAVISRARAVTAGVAPKRKAVSGSKGSAKEQGSLRQQAGPKPPRGVTRRSSSGGMEAVALPNADVGALAPRPSWSSEPAAASDHEDEAQKASSSPMPFVGNGNDNCTGTETARAASPESGCASEVVDGAAADGDGAEAKNDVVQERDAEEVTVRSPEAEAKLRNGEITSDSEIEPSYVLIKKKAVVEGEAVRLSDALGAGSDADPHIEGNAGQATTAADADMITVEIATTANTEETSDELSSFSGTGRSGRDTAPNSPPSCSSRAHSIEKLLQEDAALLRKKREEQSARGARRSAQAAVSTPPSARSRGAARMTTSPRGAAMGFKKRFLSFGKKNRGRDGGTTVIDCTSPASPADCGRARRCRTADDAIRPRVVGTSSDAAASDDTEHGYAASPQACSLQSLVAASPARSELSEMVPREKSPKSHRSFFSFRSFNCGRG